MVDQFSANALTQGKKAIKEQALAVYRETHNVAHTSDLLHMIDDTERTVVRRGNQLLKSHLENHKREN